MEINLPNENLFRRMPNMNRWFYPVLAVLVLASVGLSTFFEVGTNEIGVIQRFGKYVRSESPGLHMKLPFGIEVLRLVKTDYIFKEEFGFQTLRGGVRTEYADQLTGAELKSGRGKDLRFQKVIGFPSNSFLHESMMLTGDLSLAVVEWTVQYRFADPYKALFKVRDVTSTVRAMSEAVMRQVVGDRTVDEVITLSRTEIEVEVKQELQLLLDKFESGIQITQVILQNVNPPDEVKPSFNDVNTAKQDKERAINQAWEDYNKFVPKARGNADKTIREAEGYALERVNIAEGDAKKFVAVWEKYKGTEVVTRRRMYLETMRNLLSKIPHKILIDENLKSILPVMDLNQAAGLGQRQAAGLVQKQEGVQQ